MAAGTRGNPPAPHVLLAPIGAGGMGEGWKAQDTRLNHLVAVKRLKGQHSARFEQEAGVIAALNHSHICRIHDMVPDYRCRPIFEMHVRIAETNQQSPNSWN